MSNEYGSFVLTFKSIFNRTFLFVGEALNDGRSNLIAKVVIFFTEKQLSSLYL